MKQSPETETIIENTRELIIQPDDLLGITVSSLSPEANELFNNGTLVTPGSASNGSGSRLSEGYLVDKSGSINFPVLGKVKLAGLTKAQATDKMTLEIKKHVKNPIVNIRFLNFRFTVLGEVNKPDSYTVPTERINILEAIGLAGDLTLYGKRDNVLILREKDGVRSTARLNLAQKNLLESPYFYLQQNDIVYVEPHKIRASALSETRSDISLGLSIISLLTLILSGII
ncbi:polysaccharide biosynthesis/export family protein [Sabulibacter ruber]|uniref:polysaccharide biosynthesis/export family protein n=1 Tax=Sabulibacter ruber TaxID=2811901 RepID=UPI001F60BB91|nr:polysaccharide biosynthesis/export family protein [Sabulibacter ruber]